MERSLYESMSLTDFVQRLILKRCVMFCGAWDSYILISGHNGEANDDFLTVGTDNEKEPLVLKNTLSYDEMKVSFNV